MLDSEVPRHRAGNEHGAESERFAHWLTQILERRPDVRVRDTAAAGAVLSTSAAALTRRLAHEAPGHLETEALINEIVIMLSGYVTGGNAGLSLPQNR